MSLLWQKQYITPYELHKQLINDYVLKRQGDAKRILSRDTSNDRTDYDVIRDNHRFLWDGESADNWEEQLAKKYYDRLFKEYCIGNLTRYKENKIGLRWRTEQEVITGIGQFQCGNKCCTKQEGLRTWEVNFSYMERGEKKNALVKIRLCPDCSKKLNYHSRKREVKRLGRKPHHHKLEHNNQDSKVTTSSQKDIETESRKDISSPSHDKPSSSTNLEETISPWEAQKTTIESKSREDEMEDYLNDLLL